MKKSSISCRGFAILFVAFMAVAAPIASGAADQKPQVKNPKVLKPLQAAQEAYKSNQWDQALAKLEEADAVANKTPFEQYAINEFKSAVYLQQHKYPEAAALLDQDISSPFVPPEEITNRTENLIRLYTSTKNYPKVTEFGERWMKAGGTTPELMAFVGQGYYFQDNYPKTIEILRSAIKVAEQNGKTPDETWFNLIRSSYQKQNDIPGVVSATEEMIRYYPKQEYWETLIASRLKRKNTDRVQLNVLRLANHVGAMSGAADYAELTQALLDGGLPGEAKSVMEAGYAANAFDGLDKERAEAYQKRLNEAKAAAAKDQASLPAFEKEAGKAATGQGEVALGLAYSSFGQYEKAVDALTRGIQKGGVRDPQQAWIMLGIANVKLGRKEDAIKAFESVKDDEAMADIAHLWTLVAQSPAA